MTMLIPIRDANPYRRFPLVTVALIAINVYVFFFVAPPTDANAYQYGAIPCDLLGRCDVGPPGRQSWSTLITSMFMHGSIAHLGGNMLYLWVFGNNVEDRLGHVGYTVFYFATGLAAASAHFVTSITSDVPVIGASGAISGVLGAYFVLFPNARVLSLVPFLLFLPVEVSAKFVLGLWFVMQVLAGLGNLGMDQGGRGGVAFWAHAGGFAVGWAIMKGIGGRARVDPAERWFTRELD